MSVYLLWQVYSQKQWLRVVFPLFWNYSLKIPSVERVCKVEVSWMYKGTNSPTCWVFRFSSSSLEPQANRLHATSTTDSQVREQNSIDETRAHKDKCCLTLEWVARLHVLEVGTDDFWLLWCLAWRCVDSLDSCFSRWRNWQDYWLCFFFSMKYKNRQNGLLISVIFFNMLLKMTFQYSYQWHSS